LHVVFFPVQGQSRLGTKDGSVKIGVMSSKNHRVSRVISALRWYKKSRLDKSGTADLIKDLENIDMSL